VKRRFDEEGISIPFPQRDVHIYREEAGDTGDPGGEMQRSKTDSTAQTVVPGEDDDA
jgi:small-conductance mechanosensitive channel